MDFIGGALPNVMFLIGVIAIGIGLGLEFKIVEVKGQLSRSSRIGVITTGIMLVGVSVFLYTRPSATASSPPTAQPTITQANLAGGPAAQASVAPSAAPGAEAPAAAPTPAPTSAPAAPAPAAPAVAPGVTVPDIRGQNKKDSEKTLSAAGLLLGEQHDECKALGAQPLAGEKLKKDRILCQLPEPGTVVVSGTRINYAMAEK